MVSLVDLGPAIDTVEIRGKEIEVHGMTAQDIVMLFLEFPELRRVVTGKADADVMSIMFQQLPHILGNLVAACVGKMGDIPTVKAAEAMPLGEKWLILEKTLAITFPQGVTNFLDGLLALVPNASASGWAPATISPVPSSAASEQAETKENVGTLPLAS